MYKNKLYKISNCTTKDIPSHLGRVLPYLTDDEIEPYVLRMDEAVYCGTAYKLIDENDNTKVFAYYQQKDRQQVHGISLWWSNIKMFAIFGIWFRSYTNNRYVYIMPHVNKLIGFDFLIEEDSIRSYHFNGTALLLDLYSEKSGKIVDIYERMNVIEV